MTTVRLHHEVAGEGPDLVLLHGGGGSIEDLAALRGLLAAGRRIIAPDQRLHGRSPDPGTITYPLMAADTAALLDELGARGCDFVGWSDGGIIGLFLARDRPDLVRNVVALGANVDWSDGHQEEVLTPEATGFFEELWSNPERWPKPDPFAGTAAEWRSVLDRLVGMWRRPPGISLDDLAAITAPVLLLAGETDIVRHEHTLAMRAALPNGSFGIVPGTSHFLPVQAPEIVAALVERFLRSE